MPVLLIKCGNRNICFRPYLIDDGIKKVSSDLTGFQKGCFEAKSGLMRAVFTPKSSLRNLSGLNDDIDLIEKYIKPGGVK
jgi:hypothetical protein